MSDTDDEENDEPQEQEIYLGEYAGDRNESLERHGHGEALLPNGDRYKGDYQNGLRHGHGVYLFNKSGVRYEGEWKNGLKHGQGKFLYPGGDVYEGYWIKDNKHGYGVYTHENGDIYAGEWKMGACHGYGTYKYKDSGAKYNGYWKKDKRHGRGEILCGTYKFVGTFSQGQPIGPGKFVFLGGAEQHGHFVTVQVDPATAPVMVDTPVEEEVAESAEVEEGALVTITKWIADKIAHPDQIGKGVDPKELSKERELKQPAVPQSSALPSAWLPGKQDVEWRLQSATSGQSIFGPT